MFTTQNQQYNYDSTMTKPTIKKIDLIVLNHFVIMITVKVNNKAKKP